MMYLKNKNGWVSSLLLLCAVNIFAQAVYFISFWLANGMFSSVGSVLQWEQFFSAKSLFVPLVTFIIYEIAINGIFVGLLWYSIVSLAELFQWPATRTANFAVLFWLLTTVVILVANTYYFPNSMFALPTDSLWGIPQTGALLKQILMVLLTVLLALETLVIMHLFASLVRKKNVWRHLTVLMLLLLSAVVYGHYYLVEIPVSVASATMDKPNVIIIGLDALRPDYTSFYHNPDVKTPHIDAFLQSAAIATNAYTPLARTFPAWVSILTSRYPKHSNARENLSDFNEIKLTETLAKKFQRHGYETVYASDDTAWSVIDQHFGFDTVIGPPIGAATIMIGMMNDFPLSNLLITSPFGQFLFPSNYANHLMGFTYDPENFLHLLKAELHRRTGQPLFLAVHFNLSGWPHLWARKKGATEISQLSEFEGYKNTLGVADDQLGDFLHVLAENKLLSHTLVVLLSDHGSGFGLPGDRVTAENLYQGNKNNIKLLRFEYAVPVTDKAGRTLVRGIDTSYGYGSDVLSRSAYHTLLAFKGYGLDIGQVKNISLLSSLLDIAPTVLDLLNLPPLVTAEGASLKPYLFDPGKQADQRRLLFMETAFSVSEITGKNISIPSIIQKVAKDFQIDPQKGLISMKKTVAASTNKNSEKAVLQGDWLLANLPASIRYKSLGKSKYVSYISPAQFILVNMKTKQWTAEMDTPFAQAAPVKELFDKLFIFYGGELNL